MFAYLLCERAKWKLQNTHFSFFVSLLLLCFFYLSLHNIFQIVDVPKGKCDDAFAYIPDLGAYGVVVYSFRTEKSWRVKHNFFYFDPVSGNFDIGGVTFQWTDGIFSLALGKQQDQG